MKNLILSICAFLYILSAQAQTDSSISEFKAIMGKGYSACKSEEFTQAVKLFEAARDVVGNSTKNRDEAQSWIDSIQQLQINLLRRLNDDLVKAKAEAELAAKEAEASRLATLSVQEYRNRNYKDALLLATLAIQKNPEQPSSVVLHTFGDAAYQVHKNKISLHSTSDIEFLESFDNNVFVTATSNGQIEWRLFGSETPISTQFVQTPLSIFQITPDNNRLITSTVNGQFHLWDKFGKLIFEHTGIYQPEHIAIDKTTNMIAVGGQNGDIVCYDQNGIILDTFKVKSKIFEMRFTPEHDLIVRSTNAIKLYKFGHPEISLAEIYDKGYLSDIDVQSSSVAYFIPSENTIHWKKATIDKKVIPPFTNPIRWISVSDDYLICIANDKFLVWGFDGTVIYRDSTKGQIRSIQHISNNNALLIASSKGAYITTLDAPQSMIRLSDTATRTALYSPQNRNILTITDAGEASVWNLNGDQVVTLNNDNKPIIEGKFSNDGAYIITLGQDNSTTICPMSDFLMKRALSETIIIDNLIKTKYGL